MSTTTYPKGTAMKKTAIALSVAAALALSACGTTSGTTTDQKTGSNRPTATVTETAPPAETSEDTTVEEPEPSLTGGDPGILKMGETFTYVDGLQVTISTPTPMTSSEWAAPGSAAGLSFDVTILNGTSNPYDPSLDYLTAQIGNTEAEEIFDTDNGYDGTPMTSILPGREASYKVAFVGTDTENVVFEYVPGDWDRGGLIFTPNGE